MPLSLTPSQIEKLLTSWISAHVAAFYPLLGVDPPGPGSALHVATKALVMALVGNAITPNAGHWKNDQLRASLLVLAASYVAFRVVLRSRVTS